MPQMYQDAAAVRTAHPGQYSDMTDAQIEDALTRTGQRGIDPVGSSQTSVLSAPSALSSLGAMLGFKSPAATALGSAAGSVANKVADAYSRLKIMHEQGGGIFGPVSGEGVGDTLLSGAGNLVKDVGTDLAKNEAINYGVGAGVKGIGLKPALSATGGALTKYGVAEAAAKPTAVQALAKKAGRAVTGAAFDPLLAMFGVPHGVSEAVALAAPSIARTTGPALSAAGEALPNTVQEGLASLASRFGVAETPETATAPTTPPEGWTPKSTVSWPPNPPTTPTEAAPTPTPPPSAAPPSVQTIVPDNIPPDVAANWLGPRDTLAASMKQYPEVSGSTTGQDWSDRVHLVHAMEASANEVPGITDATGPSGLQQARDRLAAAAQAKLDAAMQGLK